MCLLPHMSNVNELLALPQAHLLTTPARAAHSQHSSPTCDGPPIQQPLSAKAKALLIDGLAQETTGGHSNTLPCPRLQHASMASKTVARVSRLLQSAVGFRVVGSHRFPRKIPALRRRDDLNIVVRHVHATHLSLSTEHEPQRFKIYTRTGDTG